MNLESGRFTQQDTFVGVDSDPASLHRYTYAANNPAVWTDPSGLMTLSETQVAQNIQSTLLTLNRTGGSVLRVYNKFEQFKSYMDLLSGISKVISMGTSGGFDNIRPIGSSALLSGVDIKEAVQSAAFYVPRAVMIGVWDWATGYISSSKGGAKITSFFINMPMVVGGLGEVSVPTGVKVEFLKEDVPIRLKFGSKNKKASGQLIGFGATMKVDRQLVRMDYHSFNPGHGGGRWIERKRNRCA